MAIQRLSIKDFLQQSNGKLLIDVRSPAEFKHAHIPGAISLPLFTDEERKIVGTTYKQHSREQAIKIGLDMFGPKMRKMVEEVERMSGEQERSEQRGVSSEQLTSNQQPATNHKDSETKDTTTNHQPSTTNSLFLYCWRGGMRSAAVAWLLDLYGFKMHTLAGGYKAYRNHVLQSFQQDYNFKIISGFTGSGKTEILNTLEKKGEAVIDLEALACHKGSAFGAIKMPPQPTQEMFENLLSCELLAASCEQSNIGSNSPFRGLGGGGGIWLEDESQRIGNLNIPSGIWETMRRSPLVFIEIPFEERLNHLTEEYSNCDKEKLKDSVQRISKRLGGLETKNTLEFLEEGNFKEAFRILLNYYDKRYLKGLHNREQLLTLLTKISCETVTASNAELLTKHQPA